MVVRGVKYIVGGKNSSGQALVLVLLSLAVVLTLVLFVLARSTTDIATSSKSEDSTRAFSAAEAGIEQALVVGIGSTAPVNVGSDASYVSEVREALVNPVEYNYPFSVGSGESATIWFADHNSDGSIGAPAFSGTLVKVCWGDGTMSNQATPAIEASFFYETTPPNLATIRIARAAFDPLTSVPRDPPNNSFADAGGAGCTIGGVSYAYQSTITLFGPPLNVNSAGLLFARIRMFYNSEPQPLGISVAGSGGTLPSQGQEISSTGSAGDANRKVQVFQSWPEPPEVFDYAIYSGTGIVK